MAYYVYLLASKKNGTLYLGVTNDIVRRVYQHRQKPFPGSPHGMAWTSLCGLKSTMIR